MRSACIWGIYGHQLSLGRDSFARHCRRFGGHCNKRQYERHQRICRTLAYGKCRYRVVSAVYGFSFLFFRIKSISSTAKRALHIIANYVFAMIAVLIIHSTAPNANASTWVVLLFFATFLFFVVYGIASLVAFLVRRKKAN